MDLEKAVGTLLSVNKQLRHENDHLKSIQNGVKENTELRTKMHPFNNDTLEEPSFPAAAGRKPSSLWQNAFDTSQFRKDIKQNKSNFRCSSPVDFNTLIQNSVHADMSERKECPSFHAESPPESKVPKRIMGEIAFQLDKRILSYIFQGHTRFYGFTMLNIQDKIIEVSTHPLTGKVDEGYRHHLTQRYNTLMEQLVQHGYKTTLHPTFTAFIVNTYGILRERSGEINAQAVDFQNPDFLKKVIMSAAPAKLKKDLLLILSCLCSMAERDRKPLVLL